MQIHAFQVIVFQDLVEIFITIFGIAGNRMAYMGGMYANLVGTTGVQFYFCMGGPVEIIQWREQALRGFAIGMHAHHTFTALQGIS